MTAREKFEANEKKIQIYNVRGGMCQVCYKIISLAESQLAHKISKSRQNIKKYGKEVIHHPKNIILTCGDKFGRCNDSVNISGNPMKVAELIEEIKEIT